MGTSFGFSILVMDQFLFTKISKKLGYWRSMRFGLVNKVISCNFIYVVHLVVSFNVVCCGSNETIQKECSAIYNYLSHHLINYAIREKGPRL